MRQAIVENGTVVNVIEAEEGFSLDGVTLMPTEEAKIGDTWDSQAGEFVPAAPQIDKEAVLATVRFAKEIGGLTIGGLTVQTDRESRANLIGARMRAVERPDYQLKWKTPAGFVTLTSPQVIALADSVSAHVEKCFIAEAACHPNLSSMATVEAIEQAYATAYAAAVTDESPLPFRIVYDESGAITTQAIDYQGG